MKTNEYLLDVIKEERTILDTVLENIGAPGRRDNLTFDSYMIGSSEGILIQYDLLN